MDVQLWQARILTVKLQPPPHIILVCQSDRETSWERINWPPHHPGVMNIKIFPKTSSKSAWANWSSMLFFSSPEVALSNMMEASSAHRSLSWTSWMVKRSPLALHVKKELAHPSISTYPSLTGSLQVECSLVPDVSTVSKAEQALLVCIQDCNIYIYIYYHARTFKVT